TPSTAVGFRRGFSVLLQKNQIRGRRIFPKAFREILMNASSGSALSLRDPHGQLIALGDRLFRLVHRSAAGFYQDILERAPIRELGKNGTVVPWSRVEPSSVPESIWS